MSIQDMEFIFTVAFFLLLAFGVWSIYGFIENKIIKWNNRKGKNKK